MVKEGKIISIIGLGNWGKEYLRTRHNFGFIFCDFVAEKTGERFKNLKFGAYFETQIEGKRVFVFKGKTFMNISGEAAKKFLDEFNLWRYEIIVCHDDLDIPFGMIRIKKNGGTGGHKGVESIVKNIGKDNIRFRFGIGRPGKDKNIADYVLSEFSDEELNNLEKILELGFSALITLASEGVEKAMSLYNSRKIL
jgi:PTH1 family peptidyl-tRNA hydrolase